MKQLLATIRAVAQGRILDMMPDVDGAERFGEPFGLEPALGVVTGDARVASARARRRMMRIIRCIDD